MDIVANWFHALKFLLSYYTSRHAVTPTTCDWKLTILYFHHNTYKQLNVICIRSTSYHTLSVSYLQSMTLTTMQSWVIYCRITFNYTLMLHVKNKKYCWVIVICRHNMLC